MDRDRPPYLQSLSCAGALLIVSTMTSCDRGSGDRIPASTSASVIAASSDTGMVAAGQPPHRGGEKAGKKTGGGQADAKCTDYETEIPSVEMKADIQNGPASPVLAAYVRDLCFAVDPDAVHKELGTLAVWIQPAMRAHRSDPRALRNGEGMVVGKIRNETGSEARLPGWKPTGKKLSDKTDALLWLSRRGAQRMAVLFELEDGNVSILARGSWTWQAEEPVPHPFAKAEWRPHAPFKGPQPPGSGWISCDLGCCTTTLLNEDS